MTLADVRREVRAEVRSRLRDLALDAAREVTLESGWASVRMGRLATAVGTSRQTLHTEFGTKEDLGRALVHRETEGYFAEVAQRLARHPDDLAAAVRDAVRYTLDATAADALLQSALTGSRAGDETLLPLLTSRSQPLLTEAVTLFTTWVAEHWPDLEAERVRVVAESVVRLLFSHVVAPSASPARTARDLGLLAAVGLGLAD